MTDIELQRAADSLAIALKKEGRVDEAATVVLLSQRLGYLNRKLQHLDAIIQAPGP